MHFTDLLVVEGWLLSLLSAIYFRNKNIKMLESSTIFLGGFVLLLYIFLKEVFQKKWHNAPPGPTGIPVLGNLYQLGRTGDPLDVIQKWKEKYGNVVAAHFGQYRVVILSGYDTIKEAYSMPEFAGRPLLKPFEAITGGEKSGLLLSEGNAWSEQRRFALRNLRDFGFGKKSMESVIQEDINDLIESFEQQKGAPYIPHRTFSTAVVRSLWSIISGERFSYGDPRFQTVLDNLHAIISGTSLTGPVFFLPWLVKLFPKLTGYNAFIKAIGGAKSLISKYITEHKKTFQSANPRDYIDIYLKEMENVKDPNSSFHNNAGGDKHLLDGTLNLFAAGSETTSNTLVWALLYLIRTPHVQERLFEEIFSLTGNSRMPSLNDKESCPYALAVMEEVFRMSSLIPLGIFHNTMEDVNFQGYFIPKDTLIAANFFGYHFEVEKWGDPEVFRPERFIKDNKFVGSLQGGVIPFAVGKRACLGETLARNNFFLYLTSLVQKFQFLSGEKGELKVETSPGLVRTPKSFKIILKERI